MIAIVLAAGIGKRLRPLTLKTPKPAVIIKGKPIIRHVLDWLENVGFDTIFIKLHYLPNQVKRAVGEDNNVKYIVERKLTPTAYFLKKHKHLLEDEFLVTNADTLTNLDLLEFIEFHLINKNIATIFTKHDALHTGGTYIFDKDILEYIHKDDDIKDMLQHLVDKNIPMNLYYSDAHYFDVGDRNRLERARKYYAK